MQSCDEKINSLINTFCDISKFADNKHAYDSFFPLQSAFLGSIVRNYKIGCLEGTFSYLIPYYVDSARKYFEYSEYPLLEASVKNYVCLQSSDIYTVQLLSIYFYPFTDYEVYAAVERKLGNKQISAEKFDKTYEQEKGHALVVLIDRDRKELRLIDPNGSHVSYANTLNELVFAHFRDSRYEEYTILPFKEACPNIGPQSITGDEKCLLWALLIGYLNLACPSSTTDIVDVITSLGRQKLIKLLEGWFCYVTSYVETSGIIQVYHFLKTGNLGKEYFRRMIDNNFQTGNITVAQKMIEVVKTYVQSHKTGAGELLERLDEYDSLDSTEREEIDASYQRYVGIY